MIEWIKMMSIRLLHWLARSQPDESVIDTPLEDEIEAEMERAQRHIREAQRRIKIIQAGLEVTTRGQR